MVDVGVRAMMGTFVDLDDVMVNLSLSLSLSDGRTAFVAPDCTHFCEPAPSGANESTNTNHTNTHARLLGTHTHTHTHTHRVPLPQQRAKRHNGNKPPYSIRFFGGPCRVSCFGSFFVHNMLSVAILFIPKCTDSKKE